MLTGLNHLTLAVTDVEHSFAFYTDLLGCKPAAIWDGGAYLTLGPLWICLSLDPARAVVPPQADYTHYAFTIAEQDFAAFRARLLLLPGSGRPPARSACRRSAQPAGRLPFAALRRDALLRLSAPTTSFDIPPMDT